MRKEGSPTTLGKAPNPTTLRIFFPVRQNDDVPKKGTRLDSPQARPSAKQTKEQASARPRSVPGQGASKKQSKQEKAPLQGGLYSRHCSQRREPNNVRESSKPDNVRNLSFPLGETTTFPKKAPGLIPPRPAPAQSNPRSKPRRIQEEAIQGAPQTKASKAQSGPSFLYQARSRPPHRRHPWQDASKKRSKARPKASPKGDPRRSLGSQGPPTEGAVKAGRPLF